MFVGPGKYKAKGLWTFRVRRSKLIALMNWLRVNNKLYRNVPFDASRFDEYPEDGPLPGIETRVVHDDVEDPDAEFAKETSGLDPHPAQSGKRLGLNDEFVFMDALGITNSTADSIGARTFEAAALTNLLPLSMKTPDVTLHRGSAAVPEYGNDKLLPGLFPGLFPFGIGGLEDWDAQGEKMRVGFRTHANYLIDLSDRRFSAHPEFMFVVVNILQRRAVHLETRFRLKSSRIESIGPEMLSVTPEQIQQVANQLSHNGSYASISPANKPVLELLRLVEMVAAKVPGSHSSKQALRRKIFSMCRHYGVPQVYLTLNPNAVHSPMFHLMAGDETIDLLSRYPRVADSVERSLRVARDPATAAYFYELSIRLVFEHLLGWDFEKGCSTPEGGILGHLEAFAMSDELTNRGMLHGHTVIWLKGGLNPGEARARLAADQDFQSRFFAFWDAAIHHHLPDVDFVKDSEVNPRQERPPEPPAFAAKLLSTNTRASSDQVDSLKQWEDEFTFEVKRMGEETQRHEHGDVCRAYKFQGTCRFQFPHEVVPESHYDHQTNSIYLRCLDPWVNYFNPELLVMTRHNHDMKCILSGKAAQAAVYYITNYITKMDVNTYHVLSMMSQAAFALKQQQLPAGQTVELRTLLHKCLAGITREQQLHAQKAARYIRGHDDSMVSHTTVPMMTGLLMQYVQNLYLGAGDFDDELDEDELGEQCEVAHESRAEDEGVPCDEPPDDLDPTHDIQLTAGGQIEVHSQLEDYLYRGEALKDLNFYTFVSQLSLVKRKSKSATFPRGFELDARHPRSETHFLQYRSKDGTGMLAREFVPLTLGPPVPRKGPGKYYRLYCLAHFKPFSIDSPLIDAGSSISDTFMAHKFDHAASRRLENWEALHECEDERDAERLRRQASKVSDRSLPYDLADVDEAGFTLDPNLIPEEGAQRATYKTWATLFESGWFTRREDETTGSLEKRFLSDNTDARLLKSTAKTWKDAVRRQENQRAVCATMLPADNSRTMLLPAPESPEVGPRTEGLPSNSVKSLSLEVAAQFAHQYNLNSAQRRAYNVTIRWFLDYISKPGTLALPKPKPLHMILHGPGGTGKTHSLLPLEDVLDFVNLSEAVVRIAPTGSAASLINGQTVHSACRIKVKRKVEDTVETFEVTWTPADRKQMQDLFGSAVLVVLDEFSLASAKMLGQIDTALRMVRQNWDEYFGGMSVILCGDLCQYPPVGETALWVPLSSAHAKPKRKNDISLERLGRLAYKTFDTVIEFTEQQRMRHDPVFGEAVRRLRLRECTSADVDLFNTRVVKSERHPLGVDLNSDQFVHASIITTNNHTRAILNEQKAKALGEHLPRYFDVAADDHIRDGGTVKQLTRVNRRRVLDMVHHDPKNQIFQGRLKLYEGMPVILRYKNLSTPLKVTNGSQGILREVSVRRDVHGEVIADAALVEFPGSDVEIPGLPPKVFPIQPLSCAFVVPMLDPESKAVVPVKMSRRQLPIEAAFAVTGHSAQGKTLPVVVNDPSVSDPQKGFYMYVSFSRARNLNSLALLSEVTLKILNIPLPPKLRFELRRLAALAHNTAVNAGDLDDDLVPVPEPEIEHLERMKTTVHGVGEVAEKRKAAEDDDLAEPEPAAKRRRVAPRTPRKPIGAKDRSPHKRVSGSSNFARVDPVAPFVGPLWDSVDWSCAYDSALVAALACWMALDARGRQDWANVSPFARTLTDSLLLVHSHPLNSRYLTLIRDSLRDSFTAAEPSLLRRGRQPAEISTILQLCSRADIRCFSLYPDITCACSSCGAVLGVGEFELRLTVQAPPDRVIRLGEWLYEELANEQQSAIPSVPSCCAPVRTSLVFEELPPILWFELDPASNVSPEKSLNVTEGREGGLYRFVAAIYLCGDGGTGGHFKTAIVSDDEVFSYDGAQLGGKLRHRFSARDGLDTLSRLDGDRACAYVYCRTAPSS